MREAYPRLRSEIRRMVRGIVWRRLTAQKIMRKAGFRPGSSSSGPPTPILSLPGTTRTCFSPTGPIWPSDPGYFAIDDGRLLGWGFNSSNIFGEIDPASYHSTPTALAPGLSDCLDVRMCGTFSALLRSDGVVYRSYESDSSFVPPGAVHTFLEIENSPGAIDIASHHETVGSWDSLYVLKDDGTVWALGNWLAGMGSGNFPYVPSYHWTNDVDVLTQMPTTKVSDVVRIQGSGTDVSSKLIFEKEDGTVGIWQNQTANPVYPTGLPADPIVKIRAASSVMILTDAGEIWVTGANGSGQYGNGTTSATSYASWHKTNLSGWTDLGIQASSPFGIRDGLLYSWGGDAFQSWTLRGSSSSVPVDVSNGRDDWLKLWANHRSPNPMATVTGGCTYTWGIQNFGQFGRGYISLPTGELFEPEQVLFPATYPPWPGP